MVVLGAGSAAIACSKLIIDLGLQPENLLMLDRMGVIHTGREDLTPYKAAFAVDTSKRSLQDAIAGADIFLGLSGADLLYPKIY